VQYQYCSVKMDVETMNTESCIMNMPKEVKLSFETFMIHLLNMNIVICDESYFMQASLDSSVFLYIKLSIQIHQQFNKRYV
jgi:hypothetical protein